ncbi:uncharacterized protein TRIVIDRAFT_195814 [Trichoderma virens Gv29-8]|uniref:NACHT domain-containing protein n=1 Tax=Hypocrea virens (strain Gv29-8 / FGSC 10586) TaxID=413071 RepID=G9NAM1_HYPVG|nr:uncharacterized protein TRIVIDRAFT_195814 [Trichoderma virens Gv29-8]EHK15882.1 hypothetical protein TRIVIDRAFT_195814 [Trichoderma virens Gv29-8]UKZ56349.1 hypothetical protein TrVGV298_010185 [Trichoderma virens]
MPSKLRIRSRVREFFSHRDDSSIQEEEIEQNGRRGQASPTATPISLAERLWDQAYDDLKKHDAALMQAYEQILSSKLGGVTSEQNIIAQSDTHARRNQMRQLIREGLNKTAKEAKVKEAIGTAISARDIISSALQAAPQAALAWAGVCVALEVIQNPIDATKANREGIEYVIKRMNMYWELSGVVLKENANDGGLSGIRRELETQVIDLYKVLLLYEIKSVCSYYRNRGLALLRDIVGLDDWSGDLKAIKDAERVFHDDSETIGRLETASDIKQLVAHALTKEDQQCIRDLRLSNPSDDKKRIEQTKGGLLQESYTWILDNAEYQQWRDSEESRLLWIKGDPGKGKTMLLCGIINELNQQSGHSGLVSYFFCQATDQQLNNASATLRGLIFMLVDQQPSLISHVRKKYDQAGGKLFEGQNTWIVLSDIFTDILRDPKLKRTYLVVDALDECVSEFEKLLDLIVHASGSEAHVKWIVSSRNWPQIEERLRNAEQKLKLSLELNAESIASAVNFYIDKKVHQLSESKKYDKETYNKVRDYLFENAKDTFLWVALVCQNLEKYTRRKVLKLLSTFPPGLDSLYKRMMKQVLDMDDKDDIYLCQRILAVMISVYRPITMRELVCLIEVPEELSVDVDYLTEIVALCGSFLTIREDTLYFVHQSAKDYLSKNKDDIFSSSYWNVHHSIFSLSLQAMDRTLRKNICSLPYLGLLTDDDVRNPNTDPLSAVRYSCVYWIDHLCEGYTSGTSNILDDDKDVYVFLQKHLLHWLEALSLLQCLAIEMAPLQTYSSALAFSPMQSLVRKAFHQEIPSWVQRWPAVEDNWSPCLQTLEGHTDSVKSVALSADRKQLASGSIDATIKIWDTSTGTCIQTLKGHTKSVGSVAFLANGLQVVSGSQDGTIKIWNTTTGMCEKSLKGHTSKVESVAALSNSLVASGSDDKTIKIWDIATGMCVQTLEGHEDSLSNSQQIISGSSDNTIKIWDVTTGACVQTLEGHNNEVNSLALLANGQLASGSWDKTIKIWDLGQIASETWDKTIKIWDVDTGACIQTLEGHSDWIRSIASSADGQYLASASDDMTVKIWDVAAGVCVRTLEGHNFYVHQVVFSRDGQQLASRSGGRAINIWDFATGACTHTLKCDGNWANELAFSADGRYLASGFVDNTVKVWNIAAEACIQNLDVGRVHHLSFDPNMNTRIYSSYGILDLDVDLDQIALVNNPGNKPPLQRVAIRGYGIDRSKEWITKDGRPVLWLPNDYRPIIANVVGQQIILGCDSGRVVIMEFSEAGPDS